MQSMKGGFFEEEDEADSPRELKRWWGCGCGYGYAHGYGYGGAGTVLAGYLPGARGAVLVRLFYTPVTRCTAATPPRQARALVSGGPSSPRRSRPSAAPRRTAAVPVVALDGPRTKTISPVEATDCTCGLVCLAACALPLRRRREESCSRAAA